MASNDPLDARSVVSRVKQLLNKNLMAILKNEGLPSSGVKAAMQARLIGHVETYVRNGDSANFNRLRNNILNPDTFLPPSTKYGPNSPTTPVASSPHQAGRGPARPYGSSNHSSHTGNPPVTGRLDFKESPFQTMLENLTTFQPCPVMKDHRHTVNTSLRLQGNVVHRLKTDPTMRVMVYCGVDTGIGLYTKTEIAFPQQVELKVNQDDIKANLRGLKNKPGSTRPADITDALRKIEKYDNTITMTYALTHKKFCYVLKLVKIHPVPELVDKLKNGRMISKEKVVREMVEKAQDSDIVETSTVMSLKCPLSTLRIDLPCRSTVCSHVQCFDASSFLQLQQQAPTWTCPICNKIVSFEALAVDGYVDEILRSTARSVEQVTIEPGGQWSASRRESLPMRMNGTGLGTDDDDDDDDDDEDEIVEIQDVRVNSLKREANPTTHQVWNSPAPSSRDASTSATPSVSRPLSGKRPASAVIDLTLSDDDEEPIRPAKRPHTNGVPTTVNDLPNGLRFSMTGGRLNPIGFRRPDTSNGTSESARQEHR
ncbi:MAG: SUMO ligase siz1 [Thelocarpon impressellum]|nr:MAG: SUMO ligase siz1 [Thelocarpon impressellum]